ncbi:MAG: MBOAT family protein, partial [Flavobacteriales bacterium]|nr:MBOAT family protein [Flavobacteriales bacterium]
GGNRSGSLFTWIMLSFIGAALILLTGWWWLPVVYLCLVAVVHVLTYISPTVRNAVSTNTNLMITMLIGGLWHGASWLFVIWGGLNGLGLVVYKYWKRISPWEGRDHWAVLAFRVLLTFAFISFTRIWFRSDSLATANAMLDRLASGIDLAVLLTVVQGTPSVFGLFALGMLVHWVPERWKERYRQGFAALPLWAMAAICVVVVVIIQQARSAEMVPFIYFQF